MTTASWGRVVRKCRNLFPLDLPVVVRFRAPGQDQGATYCYLDENDQPMRFEIWVSPAHQRVGAVDVLLHEWAHCWLWELQSAEGRYDPDATEAQQHNCEFWTIYAAFYNVWNRTVLTA